MTSMTEQLGRSVSIPEVKQPLADAFESTFDTELETTSEEELVHSEKQNSAATARRG